MKQSGFTLIELLVVLAIAVIILTTAIPSFQSFIQSNRISSTAYNFVSTLNLARSEAVKRGSLVTVCKSKDEDTCTFDADRGWEQGWIVFVDSDASGDHDAGEELIRVSGGVKGAISISAQSEVDKKISYLSSGFIQGPSGGTLDSTKSSLIICDSHSFNNSTRMITISSAGSVRSVLAADKGLSSCTI